MKSVKDLKVGSVIGDTHYYLADLLHGPHRLANKLRINEPHRVNHSVGVPLSGGSDFLASALRRRNPDAFIPYTNKELVVIEEPRVSHSDCNQAKLKAAWSYDNSSFGLVEIEVDLPTDFESYFYPEDAEPKD